MNLGKNRGLVVALAFVFFGCDQKTSVLEDKLFRPTAQRFSTIAEIPSSDEPLRTSESQEDSTKNEEARLNRLGTSYSFGPDVPLFPPIPTDNDLVENPDLFGDGPLVVPYSRCGDGIRQPLEQCDDGNPDNTDGCNIFCGLPFCGNGVTEKNEACDDGNNDYGDGCSERCQFERCGNGSLDPGEECDDGDLDNGDGCSACCKYEQCGNSTIDPGEECDDGNLKNGDGCDDCCKRETTTK